jgi:hypothetical protein
MRFTMRLKASGNFKSELRKFRNVPIRLSSDRFKTEAGRAVGDAGRRIKTRVQKTVYKQMALKPGTYQKVVVRNTRGFLRPGALKYEIYSHKGGLPIQNYKGLKALSTRGKVYKKSNEGRGSSDRGYVRSGVWNNPRTFKRSFANNNGFFAMLKKEAKRAPKALWTYGHKTSQPRGPDGKFAKSNKKYGVVRRLYGPSLAKEIPNGDSLKVFMSEGPVILREKVEKRMSKFMRF